MKGSENMEIREKQGKKIITGYVNVPEKFSKPITDKDGKIFIEKVEKGAFDKAIKEAREQGRKIPLMFKHKDIISENVEIVEDEVGVKFTAYDVNEHIFNEIMKIGGKINCSFGFKALREKVEHITCDMYKRTLEAIDLFEITVTQNPAYNSSVAYAELREGENVVLKELLELQEKISRIIEIETVKENNVEQVVENDIDETNNEVTDQEQLEETDVRVDEQEVVTSNNEIEKDATECGDCIEDDNQVEDKTEETSTEIDEDILLEILKRKVELLKIK